MAYVKRIVDDRIFEVFGTDYVMAPGSTLFLIYDARWRWADAFEFEPLEELMPDDDMFEEDEEDIKEDTDTPEQEDIKEDKL